MTKGEGKGETDGWPGFFVYPYPGCLPRSLPNGEINGN